MAGQRMDMIHSLKSRSSQNWVPLPPALVVVYAGYAKTAVSNLVHRHKRQPSYSGTPGVIFEQNEAFCATGHFRQQFGRISGVMDDIDRINKIECVVWKWQLCTIIDLDLVIRPWTGHDINRRHSLTDSYPLDRHGEPAVSGAYI